MSKFPTGYNGQKYSVHYEDLQGFPHLFGWTNDPTGGALVKAINKHPAMKNPKVIEMKNETD